MRKNKVHRKNLNLYVVYEVRGLNLDNFVNIIKKRGVELKDIKKTDGKTMRLAVNYADDEKFFAISRELCYNIKKVGEKGKLRFALNLWRNLGFLVGALVFALTAPLADDFVFAVDFFGSGSVYEREIGEYLDSRGIGKFTRFSSLNLPALSDEILAACDKISFAECLKSGNRLKINLAAAKPSEKTLSAVYGDLVSDADGEIEYIKVYRGTALKKAGDKVKKGETVCGGFAVVKDKTVSVGVIAVAAVKSEFFYEYVSDKDGEEDIAEIFAETEFGEGEITGVSTEKKVGADGKYYYGVKIVYRRILCG